MLAILTSDAKDLANQVRFSTEYKEAIRAIGEQPGRFLVPEAAEYLSGQVPA